MTFDQDFNDCYKKLNDLKAIWIWSVCLNLLLRNLSVK